MKTIRHLYSLLLLLCLTSATTLIAQAPPESFNYQAVVRNSSGNPIPNQAVSFRFSILQTSSTGSAVYVETHSPTTNSLGLVNLQIGTGTVVSGTFSSINWGADSYFLQVELDETGGTAYANLGASQLRSVPYALYANSVLNDQVDDADADPGNEIQTLSISGDSLSISGGNTIQLNDDVDDADNDPSNEYNTAISLSNDSLLLTDGGGTLGVDLSSLSSGGAWTVGSGVVYNTSDNIGIGIANPNAKLTVLDATAPTIRLGNTAFNSTESGRLIFDEDGDDTGDCGFMFDHDGASNLLRLISGCNIPQAGDTAMIVTRSSAYVQFPNRVNIGSQANPSSDLHIRQSAEGSSPSSGGIRLQGSSSSNYWQVWYANPFLSFAYNGTRLAYINNTNGAYTQVSDRRMKREIRTMDNVLAKVQQLRPVEYYYLHQEEGAKEKGFIAQEVEQIFPEFVSQDGPDQMRAIAYSNFAVVSIKAIQEQQEIINDQESRIQQLESELQEMKQLMQQVLDKRD